MTFQAGENNLGQIKAIETVYNGYRFRSRLEARWAVFFDALGIEYEYEPEGFDLGKVGRYLPDFWLPTFDTWLEVKGAKLTDSEICKCEELFRQSLKPVLLAQGQPQYGELHLFCHDTTESGGGEHWWYNCKWVDGDLPHRLAIGTDFYRGDRTLNDGIWAALRFVVDTGTDRTPSRINRAAEQARQARFEHGETPSTIEQSPQSIEGKYTSLSKKYPAVNQEAPKKTWLDRLKEIEGDKAP